MLWHEPHAACVPSTVVHAGEVLEPPLSVAPWQYAPEQLVGQLVICVANLAPRKMRFGLSEGMVVAATSPTGVHVLTVDPAALPVAGVMVRDDDAVADCPSDGFCDVDCAGDDPDCATSDDDSALDCEADGECNSACQFSADPDPDCAVTCTDIDTDGYGAGCANGDDCNDADGAVWQNLTGYRDADGDNYTVSFQQIVCSGAVLPAGWKANASAIADCDDYDQYQWNTCGVCVDNDSDGFGAGCAAAAARKSSVRAASSAPPSAWPSSRPQIPGRCASNTSSSISPRSNGSRRGPRHGIRIRCAKPGENGRRLLIVSKKRGTL